MCIYVYVYIYIYTHCTNIYYYTLFLHIVIIIVIIISYYHCYYYYYYYYWPGVCAALIVYGFRRFFGQAATVNKAEATREQQASTRVLPAYWMPTNQSNKANLTIICIYIYIYVFIYTYIYVYIYIYIYIVAGQLGHFREVAGLVPPALANHCGFVLQRDNNNNNDNDNINVIILLLLIIISIIGAPIQECTSKGI